MTSENITDIPASNNHSEILVAGGGPAGCTVAIGMARLGYDTVLLHSPRAWNCCEGISSRTLDGLRNAGLERAVATVSPPSPRSVCWNGENSAANTEHLVLRKEFDEALLQDAAAAGVRLIPGLMRGGIERSEHGIVISYDKPSGKSLKQSCRFYVDARGRSTTAQNKQKGPGTISLLQYRQGAAGRPESQLQSFCDGWAWLARMPDGQTFVQLCLDANAVQLPKRQQLSEWFNTRLEELPVLKAALGESQACGDVVARGSTSILHGQLVTPDSLRVGDAAMAVDPLSGNGIFQSLSSALAAPAVINTLLQLPGNAQLATDFYCGRIVHSFQRFTRTGRDFYQLESQWPDSPFWQQRRDWPDDEPSHSDLPPTLQSIEARPVVCDGLIVSRQVAVTDDQPLGVWHVAGIELAPLLEELPTDNSQRHSLLASRLDAACSGNTAGRLAVSAWLRRYGII